MTRSNELLIQSLNDHRVTVEVVQLNGPKRVLAARLVRPPRAAIHLVSVSSPLRLIALTPLLIARRNVYVFLHGTRGPALLSAGGRRSWIAIRRLRRVSAVWVTNSEVQRQLAEQRVHAAHVSPFSAGSSTGAPASAPGRVSRLLVAEHDNEELYGVDLAIRAVEILREDGNDVRLVVLRYGDLASVEPVPDFVDQRVNLSSKDVLHELGLCDALLRPTTTDGDSMLVREALALGRRVIASDVVPRPTGVEVTGLSPEEVARAALNGGRRVDSFCGAKPVDHAVLAALLERRRRSMRLREAWADLEDST